MRTVRGISVPPVGPGYCDDGYDWLGQLKNGWHVVPSWGRNGWDLGSWPLVVIAHYNGRAEFGIAVYIEGDIVVTGFATREERDRLTDEQAVYWWRSFDNGPPDLPSDGREPLDHHRGRYRATLPR